MQKENLNILIACEESQAFTREFRKLGHNAFSCDLKPCSGGLDQYHIQADALEIAHDKTFKWDLMIGHPPCTFISGASRGWLSHKDDKHLNIFERRRHPLYPNRLEDALKALEFVYLLASAPIEHIAIENPLGLLNQKDFIDFFDKEGIVPSFMKNKPMIIQPYMYGDHFQKRSCFWLKNLPKVKPTIEKENWIKGEMVQVKKKNGRIQNIPRWFNLARDLSDSERKEVRSKSFPLMSKAIAYTWTDYLKIYLNK